MKIINSALYKALIMAKVDEATATEASEIDVKKVSESREVKARLAIIERLQWIVISLVVVSLAQQFFF
jgi:hypothetical protein